MGEIVVQSLRTLFNDVVIKIDEVRDIRVQELRPREVAAAAMVVAMAKEGDRRWRIINGAPIRELKQAVGLLLALESALLPALRTLPKAPAVVRALGAYTAKLSEHAAAAGGQFSTQAEDLCEHLRDYARNAAVEEEAELKARVDILIGEVTALLNADDITIS